jgi:hypothetical protein
MILRDRVGRATGGEIAGDRLPVAPAVGALQEVRREVSILMILDGDIHSGGVVLRRANPGDVGVCRHARQLVDLPPVTAAVFADLDQTVVGADIQQAFAFRALGNRGKVPVQRRRRILRDRFRSPDPAHHRQGVAIDLPGQIRRDSLPGVALVVRAVQEL